MKKILLVVPMFILTIACEREPVEYFDRNCYIPEEIGDTLATGEKIFWDCDWHSSWKDGDVEVIRNEDGSVRYIGRRK
jgi:hypothetical protein